MSDPLSELLSENANPNPKRERGSFLSAIKKSSLLGNNDINIGRSESNTLDPSIDGRKAIEIENDIDSFKKEDKFSKTGGDFYSNISEPPKWTSMSNFNNINPISSPKETEPIETFGFSRRKTFVINENPKKESDDTSKSNTFKRNVKEQEEDVVNVYVPSVSKESRRTRGNFLGNEENIKSRPVSSEIDEKKEEIRLVNSLDNKKSIEQENKSDGKKENELSFRANEKSDKFKHEKEYYESQITNLKNRIDEDKQRYEDLLKEEKEKYKKKEIENDKFIEDLRSRHKSDLLMIEEKYKSNVDFLKEENKKLRSEIDKEVQSEKDRMTIIHKSDTENLENIHKKNIEQLKKIYDEQNETLKKQLQQQIEFNKLASKVEFSSKQIEEILQKFYSDKDKIGESEKVIYETKEKFFKDYEERLKDNEKYINSEKELLIKMRQDLEYRELEKRKENQEEKNRIEKEIQKLLELQNSLKTLEYNAKEKYEREKLELTQKYNDMKNEIDSLRNDYNSKNNELEYQRKMFYEEKNYFEKFKEEALKNIEIKKISLDEQKKKFFEEEREIKERIKVLQEKEFYLNEKFEEFEMKKKNIFESERKLEKDQREMISAIKRLDEDLKIYEEKNKQLEREKEMIMKKFQEFENERININSEKLRLEQSKTELRLRFQSLDMLRVKYVSSINNQSNNLDVKYNDYQNDLIKIKQPVKDEIKQSTISTKRSFNADNYLSNLKFKLSEKDHNYSSNYIQQEKEYLRNSFENIAKRDYEKNKSLSINAEKDKPEYIKTNQIIKDKSLLNEKNEDDICDF